MIEMAGSNIIIINIYIYIYICIYKPSEICYVIIYIQWLPTSSPRSG